MAWESQPCAECREGSHRALGAVKDATQWPLIQGYGGVLPRAPLRGSLLRMTAEIPVLVRATAVTLATAVLLGVGPVRAEELPEVLRTIEVRSKNGVVVANTREAAAAGAHILRDGGNAVDAAVAAALALGVSEAEASGIGGNAWLLIHLANGIDIAIDGSAAVPVGVKPEELQRQLDDGFEFGYKTVAAPGGLAALVEALQRYGTKSFADVIAPAIEIAEFGYGLPTHELAVVGAFGWKLRSNATLRDIFLNPSLEPWSSDHLYCMDELAATMRRLALGGARDFYTGGVADAIDADMRANEGFLRKSDLGMLRPVGRTPLRGSYRGLQVVSFPFPGGGGAVIEALQILDRFPREVLSSDSVDGMMIRLEAARIALYDLYVSWAVGPLEALRMLEPQRAAQRAAQIHPERARRVREILSRELVPTRQDGSTHVSVIDRDGNAVAMSLTFNEEFGACVATPGLGFPYNATLAFYDPGRPGTFLFPRRGNLLPHTMAPTMVLRGGKPFIVLGGPGTGRITSSMVNTIVNVVDRRMGAAEAVSAPRALWDGAKNPRVAIEMTTPHTEADVAELIRRGFSEVYTLRFPPRPIDLLFFGGVNLAMLDPTTGEAVGAGDPRRAGVAVGGDSP
jgi:gamma-glutamyltranspeptidase / glutathione hydrolase